MGFLVLLYCSCKYCFLYLTFKEAMLFIIIFQFRSTEIVLDNLLLQKFSHDGCPSETHND